MADVQAKVQLRERFLCLNLFTVVRSFFLFFLFSFSFVLLLQERALFADGHLISVQSFEREERSWRIRKDHYDGGREGRLRSQSCL